MKSTALPQHIIDAMNPADRKALKVKSSAERSAALDAKSEAEIQRAVEAYCVQIGFERLNTENVQRAEVRKDYPRRGWQYHLSQLGAKKNPMLPDITLFDLRGRFLWLELKAPGGKVRPLQQVMIGLGFWKVAYSATEAIELISDFAAE